MDPIKLYLPQFSTYENLIFTILSCRENYPIKSNSEILDRFPISRKTAQNQLFLLWDPAKAFNIASAEGARFTKTLHTFVTSLVSFLKHYY